MQGPIDKATMELDQKTKIKQTNKNKNKNTNKLELACHTHIEGTAWGHKREVTDTASKDIKRHSNVNFFRQDEMRYMNKDV